MIKKIIICTIICILPFTFWGCSDNTESNYDSSYDEEINVCETAGCTNSAEYIYCDECECVANCVYEKESLSSLCKEHLSCTYPEANTVIDFGKFTKAEMNEERATDLLNGYQGSDNVIAVYCYDMDLYTDDYIKPYLDILEEQNFIRGETDYDEGLTKYGYSNDIYSLLIAEAELSSKEIWIFISEK